MLRCKSYPASSSASDIRAEKTMELHAPVVLLSKLGLSKGLKNSCVLLVLQLIKKVQRKEWLHCH